VNWAHENGTFIAPPRGEAHATEVVSDELQVPEATVLPRENPLHVRHPLMAAMVIVDEGTIGTSRGKARYKSSFLARQLSVFFAPARYRVVKIMHSYSEMVLWTMQNYKAHYSLSWFMPLLYSNSPTFSGLILKMNSGYNVGEQSTQEVH
jgi:hypothetical protein